MIRSALLKHSAAAALGLALLAGCETVPMEPSPNFIGDMVVASDYAQFFRLGPQQAGGADLSLRTGERVMLQRKEFGYSRVQLENGLVGYMANEDIAPAPPNPSLRRSNASRAPAPAAATVERSLTTTISTPTYRCRIPISTSCPKISRSSPCPDLLPEPDETVRNPAPTPGPAPQPTPIKESIPGTAPDAPPPVSTST